jgi:hypothetical protein
MRCGETGGDASRLRRDDVAAGSAQDGGVLVQGWLRRSLVASRGGVLLQEMEEGEVRHLWRCRSRRKGVRGKSRQRRGWHPFKGVWRGGNGGGVRAVRVPCGTGRAWAQPTAARPRRARVGGTIRTGARRPLTDGPRLAAGGRGRGEARGCMGRPGREKRSGPSPDEQESFRFIQINFKLVRIVLIKRWNYQDLKI